MMAGDPKAGPGQRLPFPSQHHTAMSDYYLDQPQPINGYIHIDSSKQKKKNNKQVSVFFALQLKNDNVVNDDDDDDVFVKDNILLKKSNKEISNFLVHVF